MTQPATQPPGWHYGEAERLLVDAAKSDPFNEATYVAAVTRRALAHAVLATVPPHIAT